MMKKPSEAIHGILLLDKPEGITSNTALQRVKRLYGAKKAGHTGSLDPLATGMLPICFGEATKFSQYLLNADKCYEVTGRLGVKTDTSDSTGNIIATVDSVAVGDAALKQVLTTFIGQSKQIPSMFSALKHHGKPLYKLARQGVDVAREPRDITIHSLILNRFDGINFDLTVTCSKGTYIRNLVEDIGDALGVGAHVTRLHRLFTAGFEDQVMVSLERLNEESPERRMTYLLPMETAVAHFPKVELNESMVQMLRFGQVIPDIPGPQERDSYLCLYDESKQFIGLGEFTENNELKAKRLLAT